jgi:hypothetical protein
MILKAPQKIFFWPKLKKNLLKNTLSIRVRNFAPPNEPLNIYFKKKFLPRSRLHIETIWCKNEENPSDRISHAWAPLKCSYVGENISETISETVHLNCSHVRVPVFSTSARRYRVTVFSNYTVPLSCS